MTNHIPKILEIPIELFSRPLVILGRHLELHFVVDDGKDTALLEPRRLALGDETPLKYDCFSSALACS